MSINLDKLKRAAENETLEMAKLDGKLDSIKEQLRKLGYTSFRSVKASVERDTRKVSSLKKSFNKKIKTFEERYAKHLDK